MLERRWSHDDVDQCMEIGLSTVETPSAFLTLRWVLATVCHLYQKLTLTTANRHYFPSINAVTHGRIEKPTIQTMVLPQDNSLVSIGRGVSKAISLTTLFVNYSGPLILTTQRAHAGSMHLDAILVLIR